MIRSTYFTIVLTILLSSLARSYTAKVHERATTACLQNVTLLYFIPCWQENKSDKINRSVKLEWLDSCDLLARAAVDLAVERVNENKEALASSYVRIVPLFPETNDTLNLQTAAVTDAFRFVKSNKYFGVIGPSDPAGAAFWGPIFQRSNLMTVSYDVTSSVPDKVFTFYRTLPSNRAANVGRLNLIDRFKWFRIATINSQERYYAQMGNDFISLYNQNYNKVGLWPTTITHSPDSALEGVRFRDINIIFGFFGSETAREVLCRANSTPMNLMSNNHAWILPAYYNPNWWKLPAGMDSECSDEDMKAILESVIFIDTVKYPPMDLPLKDFHEQLLAKALDLFPSLTEEDLKPYLLRSRATNAYDAVTLLARSVGVAFDQGGDRCNDISVIQAAFENIFMECEYCRLNYGCFLNDTEIKQCLEFCGPEFNPTQFAGAYRDQQLRSDHLLNFYGQILYSQFIDGQECVVGLLWNGDNKLGHFYALKEDINASLCTLQMNLSHMLSNFCDKCPKTFRWKGSSGPPPSHYLLVYEVPLYQMIIISILTGIGLIIGIVLLIFNIVWRKNKVVKSTSPWLNVILTVGILLRLPVPLMDSLTLLSVKYGFDTHLMRPLCHFIFLNNSFGDVIFISALLMKIWRLYRIFNNKGMKFIGKWLSDHWLVLGVLLCSLPTAVIVITFFSFNLRLRVAEFPNERLQLHKLSFCAIDDAAVAWGIEGVSDVYSTVLLLCLLGLSLLTSLIDSPTFRREATLSLRAVTLALVPLSTLYVVFITLRTPLGFRLQRLQWIMWMWFIMNVCLPMLIMLILFGPNVYMVIKRYVKERRSEQQSELNHRYRQLLKQKQDLKMQLSQIDKRKAKIMAERQKQSQTSPGDNSSSSKTGAVHSSKQETDPDCNLKIGIVNPILLVTAENSGEESIIASQCMETSLNSTRAHKVDESIRTLYTIVSSPMEQYEVDHSTGHDNTQLSGDASACTLAE